MKLVLLLSVLFSLNSHAQITRLKILPGLLHTGGWVTAEKKSVDTSRGTMIIKLAYKIKAKALIPVPSEYLEGSMDQEMPLDFGDERGYLNLEHTRTMELEDATLIYVKRTSFQDLKNAHLIEIAAKNGKSETVVTYHPELPNLGWGKVKLTIHTPIPLLKNYSMEAVLDQK